MDELKVFESLVEFLQNPVVEVKLSAGDEVEQLRRQVDALQRENDRCMALYTQECVINMRYADTLREHGISVK